MKKKFAGIYSITSRSTGLIYIGLSTDIFSRWSSHFTHLLLQKHSSKRFQELWNTLPKEDWIFQILEVMSLSEWRVESGLKGKKLELSFKRELIRRERVWMGKYSREWVLNADTKYFLQS